MRLPFLSKQRTGKSGGAYDDTYEKQPDGSMKRVRRVAHVVSDEEAKRRRAQGDTR